MVGACSAGERNTGGGRNGAGAVDGVRVGIRTGCERSDGLHRLRGSAGRLRAAGVEDGGDTLSGRSWSRGGHWTGDCAWALFALVSIARRSNMASIHTSVMVKVVASVTV